MLVISSVNERERLAQRDAGSGSGYLHLLPDQQALVSGVCAFSRSLRSVDELPQALRDAFSLFNSARPRPVHIEIPLDLLAANADHLLLFPPPLPQPPQPAAGQIEQAARLLSKAQRPLLLIGGGALGAGPALVRRLAEALDAPTALTINAKGLLPPKHPLLLGSNQSLTPVRQLAREADLVLAVGTELGETDYDVVFDGDFDLPGTLIRIDIDAVELNCNFTPALAIHSDARLALEALLTLLEASRRPRRPEQDGSLRAARVRNELEPILQQWAPYRALFDSLEQALPGARYLGDSTQPVYYGNHLVNPAQPRRWFNSATGYGTLGYGLPAAIGAALADPDTPVVCLIGDGGLQFTLPELASAVEAKVGIVVLLWNNQGYGEIRRFMRNAGTTPLGVDIYTPDFLLLAQGFGCAAARARDHADLKRLLQQRPLDRPLLIEVPEQPPFFPAAGNQ